MENEGRLGQCTNICALNLKILVMQLAGGQRQRRRRPLIFAWCVSGPRLHEELTQKFISNNLNKLIRQNVYEFHEPKLPFTLHNLWLFLGTYVQNFGKKCYLYVKLPMFTPKNSRQPLILRRA